MQQIPSFIDARTEIQVRNTRTGEVTYFILDGTIKSDIEFRVRELDPPKNPHHSEALTFSDLRIGMTVSNENATFMETRYAFMVDGEPEPCSCKSGFKGYGKNRRKIGVMPDSLWELPVIWVSDRKFRKDRFHLERVGIIPYVLEDGTLAWNNHTYCLEVQ